MCGIVGYVGKRPVQEVLLEGLRKLEYRGYDSAGISIIAGEEIESVRAGGKLSRLDQAPPRPQRGRGGGRAPPPTAGGGWPAPPPPATTGIGHTRWATHGRVTEENAHPHFDTADRVHVVLNGIVENHVELRERLTAAGATFTSDTDAEVVAHLIAEHYDGDLVDAVRAAYLELRGHYAFVAMCADDPRLLVAARKECPLVVGVAEGERFVASAIPAFLRETRCVQQVEDDEIVAIRPEGAEFIAAASGQRVEREAK